MNSYSLGRNLLFAGCFLLPTSGYIGPFLILLACICGSYLQGFKALFVKKMYPLYFLSAFMLISIFTSPFGLRSCFGVFNWLPFFWVFWSVSIYFRDSANIKRISMSLVYGTIPVIIIGFSKLIFGLSESPRLFGSFIVWHLVDNNEFTGVFYNRNICAAWLAATFPFFVAAIWFPICSRKDVYKKVVAVLSLLSLVFAMVMTNSRSAIGSLFLGSLCMFSDFFSLDRMIGRFRSFRLFFMLLAVSVSFSIGAYLGLFRPLINTLGQFFANDDRFAIWTFAMHSVSKSFLVGSGSGGFASYVSLSSPFDRLYHHVHSLPLDLWISYGLFAMIIFLVYVFAWLSVAIRSRTLQGCIYTKAWVISFIMLIIVHIADLPYLDARINLVGWILFAGIVSFAESSLLTSSEKSGAGCG